MPATLWCQPGPSPDKSAFRNVAIPAGLLGVVALIATQEHYHPTGLTLRGGLEALSVVVVVSGIVMLWIYVRHKRLVSEGELAIGRVTELIGSSRIGTYLRYEFKTHLGSYIAWYGFPSLSTGMRLPVFYDRENPHKKVALCAAMYKVELPEEGSRKALA